MHQKTTLDNGIRVITEAMPHARSISTGIFIGTGSRYENNRNSGICHFIEHVLFKGTRKRPTSKDISEAIESVGGVINGETDKELTVFWTKVAKPDFNLSLDVLTDMLWNSLFLPEEIDKERQVIIEEICRSKDSPSQEVDLLIDGLLWPNHPLGFDIAGTRESVCGIKREDLLNFIKQEYLPENIAFSIAGDINHEEMVETINGVCGHWTKKPRNARFSPFEKKDNLRVKINNKDTEQAHMCLAVPGLSLFHPKRFAADLLNAILGAGMSSRLFTEIRDKLGLAYSIQSYVDHFLDSGSLTIYAGVEPGKLDVAIKAILEQMSLLKDGVPDNELAKAKSMSRGRLFLRMEDSYAVSGWLGAQEILTGEILTVDQVVDQLDSITAQDVQEIARELFTTEQLRLAVVGPVKDEANLEKLLNV